MKKTVIIYIDGENLRHKIRDVLVGQKIIQRKTDVIKFDFRNLVTETTGFDQGHAMRYYGTKVKVAGLSGRSQVVDAYRKAQNE